VEGLEIVKKIGRTKVGPRDRPVTDVVIETITIEKRDAS
jgi:hypothetical protein